MAPNISYDPMDMNQDGVVSNLELATAANEMNAVSGKKSTVLGKIIFGVAALVIGTAFIAAEVLWFRHKIFDVAVIGLVLAAIGIACTVYAFAKARKRNKQRALQKLVKDEIDAV